MWEFGQLHDVGTLDKPKSEKPFDNKSGKDKALEKECWCAQVPLNLQSMVNRKRGAANAWMGLPLPQHLMYYRNLKESQKVSSH